MDHDGGKSLVPHKFAFVMDPLENVLVDKDTTFVFMLEAIGSRA